MGHLVGKDVYRALGRKIDGLTARAPWSDKLEALLRELYSEDDARLVAAMPWGFSRIGRLERVTGIPRATLERQLESLCPRGLVMDVEAGGGYYYAPSPMVIGIFEFTMMRTGGALPYDRWARLFRDYLEEGGLYRANFGDGQKVSLMRAVPHDGSIAAEDYVEVLDYEKAAAIIDAADRFAIGICSCRHEHEHAGGRTCKVPLDTCSTFGATSVGFMVRNGLAREVSKAEMMDNLARSRELGLVLNADNVQRNVSFMCHCCGCCCNVLRGITRHGYPNAVVTSSYIAAPDTERCTGCGICTRKCPVQAIGSSRSRYLTAISDLRLGSGWEADLRVAPHRRGGPGGGPRSEGRTPGGRCEGSGRHRRAAHRPPGAPRHRPNARGDLGWIAPAAPDRARRRRWPPGRARRAHTGRPTRRRTSRGSGPTRALRTRMPEG